MNTKTIQNKTKILTVAAMFAYGDLLNAQTNHEPIKKDWQSNSVTIYSYNNGTNWMTVSNCLRFGDSYVACVTPEQWIKLTNAYPSNLEENVISFYRK